MDALVGVSASEATTVLGQRDGATAAMNVAGGSVDSLLLAALDDDDGAYHLTAVDAGQVRRIGPALSRTKARSGRLRSGEAVKDGQRQRGVEDEEQPVVVAVVR